MGIAITKMSSKGQVVIPAELREELDLSAGDKLVVFTKDNTMIIKRLSEPALKKTFEELVKPVRARVKKEGITRKELEHAISSMRQK